MLLNILILLKYELYPELELLADCILVTLYLLGSVLVLLIIFSIMSAISECKFQDFCNAKTKKKKKTIHFVNPSKQRRSMLEVEVLNDDTPMKLNQCIKLSTYLKAK